MKRHTFIILFFVVLAFVPILAFAAERAQCVTEGGKPCVCTTLGDCVSRLYDFSLKFVGLAVFVMLLYAGIQLMNPFTKGDARDEALEIIKNAVIGTILLFSAYVILNTINPDLTFQAISSGLPQRGQ